MAEPIDPAWNLPDAPPAHQPGAVTSAAFARLLAAAREGGWPAVWRTWAEDTSTVEPTPSTGEPRTRPARRRTLGQFLDRRPDLKMLLDDAAQAKRDRLLNQLEDVAEQVALGPPDTTTDFDNNGNVKRVRTDSRNRNFMVVTLLKSLDREKYGDQRQVKVDGQIDHRHAHAHLGVNPGGYVVSIDAIQAAALTESETRTLLTLLEKVEQARIEQRQQQRALTGQAMPQNHNGETE